MSYNIYYEGTVSINKPLDDQTYNIIMGLSDSRRMAWNADKLERDGIAKKKDIGEEGEFFFGHNHMKHEELIEFEKKYALNINYPPAGQPSYWGTWIVSDDKMGLIWNGNEKSYNGHEWLQYIVKKILIPRGYNTEGIVNWFTEEEMYDNEWHTVVKGKSVRKYRGYNKNQKEPDMGEWYDEELEEYDNCHQQWLQKLITNKIEFLHQSTLMRRDNTDAKLVLSFNLLVDNNIVQAVYDEKYICHSKYLYKNIRTEDDKIVYEECNC